MYIYSHSSIYKSPLEQWTLGSLHTREVGSATTALPDWWLSPGYKNIYLYVLIYQPGVSVSESSDRLSKASALVASHGSGSQSDDSGSSDKRLVVSSLCSGRETRHGERLLYHLSSFCPLTLSLFLSLSLSQQEMSGHRCSQSFTRRC